MHCDVGQYIFKVVPKILAIASVFFGGKAATNRRRTTTSGSLLFFFFLVSLADDVWSFICVIRFKERLFRAKKMKGEKRTNV